MSRLSTRRPCITESFRSSITGLFKYGDKIQRALPTMTDSTTHETIHPSVLKQKDQVPKLAEIIEKNPSLVGKLLPLEDELRKNWKVTDCGAKPIQRLGAAIETMHSSELARDDNKAGAAQEASGTVSFGGRMVGTSVVTFVSGFL